jgi:hypothetical protein
MVAAILAAVTAHSAHSQSTPRSAHREAARAAASADSLAALRAAQADSSAIAGVVQDIVAGQPSEYERARAIYAWLATHIEYDVATYLSGANGDMSSIGTFRRRTAVCEGYANLFLHMAALAGVEAVKITGYAKGFDYRPGARTKRPNHAWLAFRTSDGQWRLADPTWGAGHVNGQRFERAFSWWYFDVAPAALMLSHHPDESRWQLVPRAMSRRDFEHLAMVPRTLMEAGIAPADLRQAAQARNHPGFPIVNPIVGVRLVDTPLSSRLRAGSAERLEVSWPGAQELVVTNNGQWLPMVKGADGFSLDVTPVTGPLLIIGKAPGDTEYRTIVAYEVR